jgi:3-phenylpropionate/trans-cinnamate dioxygenase ferredoxin subunit
MTDTLDICTLEELPPGAMRLVEHDGLEIGVFNCAGTVYAIEDRFDLKTGKPRTLPAYQPVDTFPVIIDNEMIKLEVE